MQASPPGHHLFITHLTDPLCDSAVSSSTHPPADAARHTQAALSPTVKVMATHPPPPEAPLVELVLVAPEERPGSPTPPQRPPPLVRPVCVPPSSSLLALLLCATGRTTQRTRVVKVPHCLRMSACAALTPSSISPNTVAVVGGGCSPVTQHEQAANMQSTTDFLSASSWAVLWLLMQLITHPPCCAPSFPSAVCTWCTEPSTAHLAARRAGSPQLTPSAKARTAPGVWHGVHDSGCCTGQLIINQCCSSSVGCCQCSVFDWTRLHLGG
jgi:hypothetical protein